jgi:3D (Asp-Asp-Asp) domain-containing protein
MKRNWIFIAVLCLIPYNVITSVSDMKTDITITEKKVKEIVAEEFRKVVTLTTYSVTEEETDSSPTITASGFEIDENNPNKHRIIAVSRDLMNSRFRNKIDVLIDEDDKQTKMFGVIIKKLD